MKKISIFFLFFIFSFSKVFADENLNFNKWKNDFKILALSNNISEKTFNQVMKNVRFLPNVIKYDRYQPEFYEDTHTYINKRTSNNKVKKGLLLYSKEKKLINQIENYQKPQPMNQIIYLFWLYYHL